MRTPSSHRKNAALQFFCNTGPQGRHENTLDQKNDEVTQHRDMERYLEAPVSNAEPDADGP